MNCTHCESVRAAHREIMDRFGVDHLPRWGERPDIDAELFTTRPSSAGAAQCPCECHAPARIVGILPKLAAA